MTNPSAEEPVAEIISRFNAFIRQAREVMSHAEALMGTSSSPCTLPSSIDPFELFVKRAAPVVADQVKVTLRTHGKRLDNICRWLVPRACDVLTAIGLSKDEVRCTKLIAWMLWPYERQDLALRLQQAWLKALGQDGVAAMLERAVEPRTEVSTDGGRADMVLNYVHPDFILIVEAKMDSEEHYTPDAQWQTEGYPAAVRRSLDLPEKHPGVMVFLTPDGREPHAKAAIVTTYEALTTLIAETLSPEEVSPEMRWAYSAAITHLVTCTARGGEAYVDAIHKYAGRRTVDFTTDQVLRDLAFLGPLCRTLRMGAQI